MKKYVFGAIIVVLVIALFAFKPKNSQNSVVIQTTPNLKYVALGDSVAAGVGLMNDSDYSACNRTDESYPSIISDTLNLKLYNLACSGATYPAGVLGKQDVNKLPVETQINQLFQINSPKLITITAGANDAKWTEFISKCYTSQCGTLKDTYAVDGLINQVSTNLNKTLSQINNHFSSSKPIVLITGYYQPFPIKLISCSDLSGINGTELAWSREQQTKLNSALSEATSHYKFAHFVPISFAGHELCSADSWVQGLSDSQPFHPTADGQKAYAQQIEMVYSKLGANK